MLDKIFSTSKASRGVFGAWLTEADHQAPLDDTVPDARNFAEAEMDTRRGEHIPVEPPVAPPLRCAPTRRDRHVTGSKRHVRYIAGQLCAFDGEAVRSADGCDLGGFPQQAAPHRAIAPTRRGKDRDFKGGLASAHDLANVVDREPSVGCRGRGLRLPGRDAGHARQSGKPPEQPDRPYLRSLHIRPVPLHRKNEGRWRPDASDPPSRSAC